VDFGRRGSQQPHYSVGLAFGGETDRQDIAKAIRGGFWIARPLIIPRNIA